MIAKPLATFGDNLRVAVIGAHGALGSAFIRHLEQSPHVGRIFALSRRHENDGDERLQDGKKRALFLDLEDESSIAKAAQAIRDDAAGLDVILCATGLLHDAKGLSPEKSWRMLAPQAMAQSFAINAMGPALVAKHMLPLLPRDRRVAFAALSARVGSISDNHLGGWYSYRAAKAALNMMIRSLAIELARKNDQALCVGLHPGTVDSHLSAPFQSQVPAAKLFSADDSAGWLLDVLDGLKPDDSGGCFAWDGKAIAP
ncbi:SDR family oxidoreductase [Iodidimonas nitroreducens]|uniref:SDR family oxidoreductase n=1 Tax=Iodidimonas nitroreducens TaxID=1236968 RepID=A0A5A7N8P3_9PROT|nr:SDR family NAD(P)-dependent oxidoreductase [Iodidimonas nitroreducens]GAK33505.1 putative oxidoreductase C663.09c [alpha proteobacterium Q-1]GER04448.1 SDR family oxidoreductase [Iodidimonas nitroreducens]